MACLRPPPAQACDHAGGAGGVAAGVQSQQCIEVVAGLDAADRSRLSATQSDFDGVLGLRSGWLAGWFDRRVPSASAEHDEGEHREEAATASARLAVGATPLAPVQWITPRSGG